MQFVKRQGFFLPRHAGSPHMPKRVKKCEKVGKLFLTPDKSLTVCKLFHPVKSCFCLDFRHGGSKHRWRTFGGFSEDCYAGDIPRLV